MKMRRYITCLLLAAQSLWAESNSTDTNNTKPPIVNFIDMNMMDSRFQYMDRKKDHIALVFVQDWCQASRHFLANVAPFDDLWGDDTAIILVNAGNNHQWVVNRYDVDWRVIDGPARQDLIDWFKVKQLPKLVLVDTKTGTSMNREQWKQIQNDE